MQDLDQVLGPGPGPGPEPGKVAIGVSRAVSVRAIRRLLEFRLWCIMYGLEGDRCGIGRGIGD